MSRGHTQLSGWVGEHPSVFGHVPRSRQRLTSMIQCSTVKMLAGYSIPPIFTYKPASGLVAQEAEAPTAAQVPAAAPASQTPKRLIAVACGGECENIAEVRGEVVSGQSCL
jgi:hypothetical protein